MRERGFTLIELLVVLVIIGLVTSFAVVMFGGNSLDQAAEKEVRRAAALLELVSQQAVLEGREYGVGFTRSGYHFYRYDNNEWAQIADDPLLRPRTLESGLEFVLYVEDEPVQLGGKRGHGAMPQLMLYSSGERTPFELLVAPLHTSSGPMLRAKNFGRMQVDLQGAS